MINYDEILKLYKNEDLKAHGLTRKEVREIMENLSFQENDLFRFTFASGDEKSKKILRTFASLITKRKVVDTLIKNSEPVKQGYHQKGSRLDVLATVLDENGTQSVLNLEIQNYGTTLQNSLRAQGYTAKLINDQIMQGEGYEFFMTYQVTICNRLDRFKEIEKFYHEHRYMDIETHKLMPDERSAIIFIELDKLSQLENKPIEQWSEMEKMGYILKYGNKKEKYGIIKTLENTMEVAELMKEKREDYFKNTVEALEAMRTYYDQKQEILEKGYIFESGVEEGLIKGKQAGIKEGTQGEKLRTAKAMLEDGVNDDFILKYTGILNEELQQLKQSIK